MEKLESSTALEYDDDNGNFDGIFALLSDKVEISQTTVQIS